MATTKENAIVRTFEFERETKNTLRFAEVEVKGQPVVVGTLYVSKLVLDGKSPAKVTVAIGIDAE